MYDERDSRITPERTSLQGLYADRKIVPVRRGFGCVSFTRCSESGRIPLHTGNWAFVGCDYGNARVDGHLSRILFVAMDRGGYGGADEEAFPDTQSSFRRSIELPRNPHMGGVALILKHLLDERDPRRLSGQCALTNAVKCVQHTASMNTNATGTMIRECATHLRAEIQLLQPHLIVTQGDHPGDTVVGSLGGLRLVREVVGERGRRAAVHENGRVVLLVTPHPARQAGLKWSRGELPRFFLDAISIARAELARQLTLRASAC